MKTNTIVGMSVGIAVAIVFAAFGIASADTFAPTTCNIQANPLTIQNGQAATLSWTSVGNVSSAWLSDGLGAVPPSGTLPVRPESSRIYTLTVVGQFGTQTCSTQLQVVGGNASPYLSLTQIPYTGVAGETLASSMLALFGLAVGYLAIFYSRKLAVK